MKKIHSALLGMCVMMSSCSSDIFENNNNAGNGKYNLSVSILTNTDIKTRTDDNGKSFSDGSTVNNLKCYVYSTSHGDNADPILIQNVEIIDREDGRGANLALDLPSGQGYDFVFLATAMPQENTASKVYYSPSLRYLNVNYDKMKSCDEDVDCFYGVIKGASSAKGSEYAVTLRRPFAQLNIGTKDLKSYNEFSSSPLKSVGVTVDGVYSSMNVMDGSVIGDPCVATIASAPLPSDQNYPVSGNEYLSMCYFLVNDRKNVNVTMITINNETSYYRLFSTIPVQRNFQTNIYGKLLTKETDFHVGIDPIYERRE